MPGNAAEQGALDEHAQVGEFGEERHDAFGAVGGEETGDEERVDRDLVKQRGRVGVAQFLDAFG